MSCNPASLAVGCHEGLFLRKNSLAAIFLAAFLPAFTAISQAAVPGSNITGNEAKRDNMAEALPALATHPIKDCLLQRPITPGPEGTPGVHITYPAIGNKQVDADINQWVSELADAFVNNLDFGTNGTDLLSSLDMDLDPANFRAADTTFELWGNYSVTRPSPIAISIAFELWNYTGSSEANLDILTLNYSLVTGQRLNLVDIFEKPDLALQLMSDWSRKVLEKRLGAARRTAMLNDGTEPLIENFSSLTLTPEGICINFQPWQVAPREAGIQRVHMPLEELLPSSPLLALWGK